MYIILGVFSASVFCPGARIETAWGQQQKGEVDFYHSVGWTNERLGLSFGMGMPCSGVSLLGSWLPRADRYGSGAEPGLSPRLCEERTEMALSHHRLPHGNLFSISVERICREGSSLGGP